MRYDSDAYDDELPYWLTEGSRSYLVIPYNLLTNDIRYLTAPGCATAADFFALLRDAFDLLWTEGQDHPRRLSIGLYARISGQAARAAAISRFLDDVAKREGVWICRRREITEYWRQRFAPPEEGA